MRPTVGLFGVLARVNTVHARRYVHVTFGHQGIQAAWRKRNIRPLKVNMIGSIYLCCKRLQLVIVVKIHKRLCDIMQWCLMGRHQCFGLTLVTFFFWVEDGGPRYLWNCVSCLQNYVVSYNRRLCCELISSACNLLVSLLLYTFMLNTLK